MAVFVCVCVCVCVRRSLCQRNPWCFIGWSNMYIKWPFRNWVAFIELQRATVWLWAFIFTLWVLVCIFPQAIWHAEVYLVTVQLIIMDLH